MNAINPFTDEPCLVSMNDVVAMTSLSRFPAAIPLGDKRIAFLKSEILEWIVGRVAARGANDNVKQREVA